MERCKTCKFWEPPKSQSYGEVPGVGRCQKVVQFWDSAEWDEDGDGRKLRPEFADALAFVQDGSDYRADLYTKPEFGCVQHASTSLAVTRLSVAKVALTTMLGGRRPERTEMPKYLDGNLCNEAYAVAARYALDRAYPVRRYGDGPDGPTRYDFWNIYDGCFFE